jgi:hypothetical protein
MENQNQLQPRKLQRNDWSPISIELKRYYDGLVKQLEADTPAFFDRVMTRAEQTESVSR